MKRLLLSVDLGLRAGVAWFEEGRLIRYRSQNFGTVARLKKAAFSELEGVAKLDALIVEGDRNLAKHWARIAVKRGALVYSIHAHDWRHLLPGRDLKTGEAKEQAGVMARRIISAHGAPKPKARRHDAAEAIVMGYWGCLERGYALPVD